MISWVQIDLENKIKRVLPKVRAKKLSIPKMSDEILLKGLTASVIVMVVTKIFLLLGRYDKSD